MEKDRSSKILAIIALVVAVVGLSLGFAAFSQTLTIKSQADVKVDQTDFTSNVKFVTTEGSDDGEIKATTEGEGVTADNASLTATIIQNINVHFTKPGQSATYSFKVKNASQYDAYLRSVTFKNVAEGNAPIECTVLHHPGALGNTDGDETQVQAACKGIKVTVTVGGTGYTQSNAAISGHSLEKLTGEEDASVKIEYEAGSDTSDGDFNIAIGDIELLYSSRDAA